MQSVLPSLATRQSLRVRPRSTVKLDRTWTALATRRASVKGAPTASASICPGAGTPAPRLFHTEAARSQAVEVASQSTQASSVAINESQSLSEIIRRAQSIVDPNYQILSAEWADRVQLLSRKAHGLETGTPNRIVLVGSSLSQTQQLLAALIDEPLREISDSQNNEAGAILAALARLPPSTPFTITYAHGPLRLLDETSAAVDRHWLQQADFQLTVLLDPALSESTCDLLYDSEAVLFVTDDYVLSRSAHRSRSRDGRGDATHELLSRFAAKPNVHLVVNSVLGLDLKHIIDGLEAATGASVTELVAPSLLSVRTSDALAANAALRQALELKQQTPPQGLAHPPSAGWEEFSSHYQRSNVGSLIGLIQALQSRHDSEFLVAQSAQFLLQHCLDEALAVAKHNMACLHQLRSIADQAKDRERMTVKRSLERIWPPASAYSGQLSRDEIKVWRPASPGSPSAVEEAMQETDDRIESTFDTKLQWWKLIWKVDDVRKELESACAGFAASLESDLAYESGRLATLQFEQVRLADQLLLQFRQLALQLAPSIATASRDVALLTNEAEAYRSSKLRTIEPSTLMEPIHRRRQQLLQAGGPIDVLASESRKLAVTSSAALAVTAAGVGSASVLGFSLGLDASSAALALDPSTGFGLGLLTLALVGWRMQGQYNKLRRRFREDWQRFSEGLDQDLKGNLEAVLQRQITGPSSLVSCRIAALTRSWAHMVKEQETHVRNVAAETSHLLSAPAKATEATQARGPL